MGHTMVEKILGAHAGRDVSPGEIVDVVIDVRPAEPEVIAKERALVEAGSLKLGGLITHTRKAGEAPEAYATAFNDPACLKMILEWKDAA